MINLLIIKYQKNMYDIYLQLKKNLIKQINETTKNDI